MQPNDRIHFRDGYFDHIMSVLALGKATKAEQRDMAVQLEKVFEKCEGYEHPPHGTVAECPSCHARGLAVLADQGLVCQHCGESRE